MPSENWEGTSWGMFTGDDDAMRIMAGRIVEQMEKLEVEILARMRAGPSRDPVGF